MIPICSYQSASGQRPTAAPTSGPSPRSGRRNPRGGGLLQLLSLRRGVVARLDGGDLDAEVRLDLGDAPNGRVEEGFVSFGAVDEVADLHGVLVSGGESYNSSNKRRRHLITIIIAGLNEIIFIIVIGGGFRFTRHKIAF